MPALKTVRPPTSRDTEPQRRTRLLAALGITALALVVTALHAQAEDIPRFRIAAGGGTSSAGAYRLVGTFAQSDAALSSATGYRLQGGFWSPHTAAGAELFSDGFE